MTRRRLGAHGRPLMWTDNKVRMTIRPEPTVLDAEDLAMLLGHRLDIQHDFYSTNTIDEAKAAFMIWEYENDQKLTQKHALELVSDSYYLGNYNMGSDMHEIFDRNEPHHLVLLRLVHRIWPQFADDACEAE